MNDSVGVSSVLYGNEPPLHPATLFCAFQEPIASNITIYGHTLQRSSPPPLPLTRYDRLDSSSGGGIFDFWHTYIIYLKSKIPVYFTEFFVRKYHHYKVELYRVYTHVVSSSFVVLFVTFTSGALVLTVAAKSLDTPKHLVLHVKLSLKGIILINKVSKTLFIFVIQEIQLEIIRIFGIIQ